MSNPLAGSATPAAEVAFNPSTGKPAGFPQAAVLLAGSIMPVMAAVLLAPVLPTVSKVFAGQPGATAIVPSLLAAPALVVGILAPFAGTIADRVGRKALLVAGLIAYAILGTAPVFLSSLYAILATRLAVGVAEAAIYTCCTALLADYFFGSRRSRILGLQSGVLAIGATVFLLLGGLIGSISWRSPFWLYTAALLIAVAVVGIVWKPAEEANATSHTASLPPLPTRSLLLPYGMTFFGGIVMYSVIVELPYVLESRGATNIAFIGIATALPQIATAIAGISFRWVARYGVARLLPIAFALSGAGLIMLWLAPTVPVAVIAAMLTSGGAGLFVPTLLVWSLSGLSFDQRGRGSGRWTAALFLGQFASALVIIALGAAVGGLSPALGVLGIVSALAALTLSLVLSRKQQRSLVGAQRGADQATGVSERNGAEEGAR